MSQFGHETLNVYKESIHFITWISELLESIPKNLSVHGQLDRASTSIPLNIAEGIGKVHMNVKILILQEQYFGFVLRSALCSEKLKRCHNFLLKDFVRFLFCP